MKHKNYKELLKQAENLKINPTKLFIAEEVSAIIGIDSKFDEYCELVYELYLDISDISINEVVNCIYDLLQTNEEYDYLYLKQKLTFVWLLYNNF